MGKSETLILAMLVWRHYGWRYGVRRLVKGCAIRAHSHVKLSQLYHPSTATPFSFRGSGWGCTPAMAVMLSFAAVANATP